MVATLAGLYRASWLVARGLVGLIDRRLAVVAVLFALLLVSSSLVFDEELGISLLNSFYFTVTTVMGVGYGDITLLDAEPGVKLFGTAIMVLGGVALALVFALLTDAIVGARLAQALGQGPLPRRGHVVVCGAGKTGGRVIEAIAEADVPCIAIDRDAEIDNAALLKRLSVPLVVGDAASGETLDGVRLSSARALVAVTDDDLANLQCALLAHARAPDLRVILRLFNHDLAMRVQRASGIELSHSVASLAAPAFVAAILGRPATAVLPVGSEVLLVVELTAERFSDVHTLEQDCQARVLAIDGVAFPTADAHVASGAGVLVIGTGAALVELERRLVSSAAPA